MSAKRRTLERSSSERFGAKAVRRSPRQSFKAKIAELKDQMRTLEQPSVRHDLKVDLVKYHNAILKIAYEFAWLWLGDAYLEDPVAVKLRRKILENADEQIGGVIQIGTTVPFDTMWTDEPSSYRLAKSPAVWLPSQCGFSTCCAVWWSSPRNLLAIQDSAKDGSFAAILKPRKRGIRPFRKRLSVSSVRGGWHG